MNLLLKYILPQLSMNCIVSRWLYIVSLLLPGNKYILSCSTLVFSVLLYFSTHTKLTTEGTSRKKQIKQSLEAEGVKILLLFWFLRWQKSSSIPLSHHWFQRELQHPNSRQSLPLWRDPAASQPCPPSLAPHPQQKPNPCLVFSLQSVSLNPWFAAQSRFLHQTLFPRLLGQDLTSRSPNPQLRSTGTAAH